MNSSPPAKTSNRSILLRGLRRLCPRCGNGRMFESWHQLATRCSHCGLRFDLREGNSWWFMYYSTALFTGFIILAMLRIRPQNLWLGRTLVLVAAVAFIVGSLPYRKGLALAIDYLSDRYTDPNDDGP